MKINYERIVRPHIQAILILITSTLLLFLTLRSLYKFQNLDPSPSVGQISDLKIKNKNIISIPTGFYVRNFLDFDILKNEFIIEAVIWFIIDPNKVPIETLGKFSFSKGLFLKATLMTSNPPPIIKKISKDKQLVQYDIRIKFSSNLNYRLFPLDSHRLYLALTNKYFSAEDFYFDIDPMKFIVSKNIFTYGWKNIGNHVKTGYIDIPIGSEIMQKNINPRIVFSFDFILNSLRNILLIFMPLFVVFFLSLFSFSFDPTRNRETIMNISAAVVPAILGYRFVIETVSPKVSYFMLSDQIFNMFLILSFFIFFINEFYLWKIKQYRGLLILSFHIILIAYWYYLLYIWA